jgi:hypothetical protein
MIDRTQDRTSQNKIYINGVLSYVQMSSYTTDNNGNFVNNILFIGQRGGSTTGFNGSLQDFKVYNRVLTDSEIMDLYSE